jgi:hypothetical protein
MLFSIISCLFHIYLKISSFQAVDFYISPLFPSFIAYSLDVLFAIAAGLEVDVIKFFMPIEENK